MPVLARATLAALAAASLASCTHSAQNAGADHLEAALDRPIIFSGVVGGSAGIFRLDDLDDPDSARLLVSGANWPVPAAGGRIVYHARAGDTLDIWSCDAEGGDIRRLTTDPAHDYLPAPSPDGQWIVFSSWRSEPGDPPDTTGPRLYLMRSDGTAQRRIMDEPLGTSAGAVWTRDGGAVVFPWKQPDDRIVLFSAPVAPHRNQPLGPAQRLTEGESSVGAPTVSPDGRMVAFNARGSVATRIVVMDMSNRRQRVLVADGFNWYPRWSPDGRWLLFTRPASGAEDDPDLDLYAVRVDGDGTEPPVPVLVLPGRQGEGWFVP
ncbi:MAG: PD40 domain-containing protein [Phycisphaerales bacterium]|nr:PD40 domain-containing protein [Phycisphaerales bacterium]